MTRPRRRITVGMLKAMPGKWSVAANWRLFESQVQAHRSTQFDVIVTPECFLDGYAVTEKDWTVRRFARAAQDVSTSEYIRGVRNLARSRRSNVVFGFTERVGDTFLSAALVVDRKGEIVGRYYKTHLQNHDRRFTRGEDLPVFDLDIGTVGIVICADRRWPETLRTLRLKGAKVCLMPTHGMWHADNEWWMRTRSYENQMFGCFTHPNVALITDPKGGVAAKLQSNVPDMLVHEIDLSEAGDGNHLANRRPELYGAIVDPAHPSSQAPYVPEQK